MIFVIWGRKVPSMEPLTSPRKLTLPRLEISWIWPLSQEIPFSGCQACEDLWDEERPEASSTSLLLPRNCIFKRRFMAKQIAPFEPSLWQHENRASAAKFEIEHFYMFSSLQEGKVNLLVNWTSIWSTSIYYKYFRVDSLPSTILSASSVWNGLGGWLIFWRSSECCSDSERNTIKCCLLENPVGVSCAFSWIRNFRIKILQDAVRKSL